jgi:hypothetical protein
VLLTARARYLLHQVGVDPSASGALEIVAVKARALRDLIRHWWEALEPEATAGVVAPMMEEALAAFAEQSLKKSNRTFARKWARSWFDWKPRVLQSEAEQVIGERFLIAVERLGVLATQGPLLTFTHPALHELYLGMHYLATGTLPAFLSALPRTALHPLQTAEGHAVIAKLALTAADQRRTALAEVARRNLHLAAWSLWGDGEARAEHGEWLATEILSEVQWEQPAANPETLAGALASLGAPALSTCRAWLDALEANLPALLIVMRIIAHSGSVDDLPRLQRLADHPYLGQWEIDQMRQLLRDAEAKVIDAEARKQYSQQEMKEMAKDMAALVLKIAGTIAAKTTEPLPWGGNTVVHVVGGLAEGASEHVAAITPSEFFRTQQYLRGLLAVLPPIIERRKGEIYRMAPAVREAAQSAILALGAGTRAAG